MDGFIRNFWMLRRWAKRHKLTEHDVAILAYLGFCEAKKTRPACIKAALSISLAQISRTFTRLETRKLIQLKHSTEDRRVVYASLTVAGRCAYQGMLCELAGDFSRAGNVA